ncbi:hypothetical protein [Tetragenococcus halophilus]|uniref:hypothetical protein n=2 Tax=Tetragenococcus halophilus TaxID=51669 RepID=UPI001F48DC4B|nr:hypothetical protein [Tetragenococcus halophilus]MDN6184996.1 hypothetical protein [Lactococcus lactis]MDN6271008.1 hypothetical protein [Tetragenococcus koreensis]MCF1602154.1 hypothetical protein [Tetragenococcus halophilus]MDN6391991.1 hypothetical protein [Lactococcus lactis]MDN6498011.1 hypothetical protein [Tetragenococcus koreensis]
MKSNGIETMQKNRKETSIKAMYFNRYLLVRYVAALFLFTNIYWGILLVMSHSSLYFIPFTLAVVTGVIFLEQIKIYHAHTNDAKYTHFSFITLISSNIILLPITFFSGNFNRLYPFFVNQYQSRILISGILIFGILLSMVVLYRLSEIRQNKDKSYSRITKYETAMNSN